MEEFYLLLFECKNAIYKHTDYSQASANMISYNMISHNMMFQFGSKKFL